MATVEWSSFCSVNTWPLMPSTTMTGDQFTAPPVGVRYGPFAVSALSTCQVYAQKAVLRLAQLHRIYLPYVHQSLVHLGL